MAHPLVYKNHQKFTIQMRPHFKENLYSLVPWEFFEGTPKFYGSTQEYSSVFDAFISIVFHLYI